MVIENGLVTYGQSLIYAYSYFGVFILSLLVTAFLILLPFPTILPIVILASAFLNPWLVGVAAGFGASIGEFSGYFTGLGTRHFLSRNGKERRLKYIKKLEDLIKKHGFIMIIVLSFTPLPTNTLGITSGIIRYKKLKFFLGVLMGRIFIYMVYANIGFYGIRFFF